MKKNVVFYLALLFVMLAINPMSAQRQMEYLDRGLVAIKVKSGVYLSWRVLGDEKDIAYNVYKNGTLFQSVSATQASNLTDASGTVSDKYVIKAVVEGVEEAEGSKEVSPWAQQSQPYLPVQLNRPQAGVTPPNYTYDGTTYTRWSKGEPYSYFPGDSGVGDLDGDGELDIVIMWRPTNGKDNAHCGITGNVFLDGYKLDGTFMWRIDLGINIRAGSHYTQLLVYDFDGDGKAEIVCKTAPGTIDGKGNNVIMEGDDPTADYRGRSANRNCGYIVSGPEYLTIFDGMTGAELSTVSYEVARGNIVDWGDDYGNRVDRFLACVAYLDGERPSAVMCRGYYARTTLAAYDFIDGKLELRWIHDSSTPDEGAYHEGNHNLSVADVDGDGKDEIIYGSCAFNSDGTLRYRTGLGHGDAIHVSTMDPDRPGKFQVWQVFEGGNPLYAAALIDTDTGDILWGHGEGGIDNGRGLAADIDANHPGFEMWSYSVNGTYNCKGELISPNKPTISFRFYWDGDLQDEIIDGGKWYKWNGVSVGGFTKFDGSTVYGSKKAPVMLGDLFGDWREEVVLFEENDSSKIRIYTTIIPTEHRLYTLMYDPVYRNAIAWQNIGYNQPPHLGFYIGDGVDNIPWPDMYTPVYDGPPYGNSIEQIEAEDSSLNAFIDKGVLHVCSESNIQSVRVYSIDGALVKSLLPKNENTIGIPLTKGQNQILVVNAVSEAGAKAFKLINH